MSIIKPLIKIITICLFGLIISCGERSGKIVDPIVEAPADDPELRQAQVDAQTNLDHFIKAFETYSMDTSYSFSLKADFSERDEHEHMWIALNKINNGRFDGYLANDPQIIKNIKFGDPVTLSTKQIEDWVIHNSTDDTMEGGYSIKVFEQREKQ